MLDLDQDANLNVLKCVERVKLIEALQLMLDSSVLCSAASVVLHLVHSLLLA